MTDSTAQNSYCVGLETKSCPISYGKLMVKYDRTWFPDNVVNNELDLQGISLDFPPNRLKQGHGEAVVFVLDRLADLALKSTNFSWQQ